MQKEATGRTARASCVSAQSVTRADKKCKCTSNTSSTRLFCCCFLCKYTFTLPAMSFKLPLGFMPSASRGELVIKCRNLRAFPIRVRVPFAGRMAALEPADDESDDGKPKIPPGKLYPLPPPRLPPPVLDYGGLAVHDYEDGSRYAGDWVRGMRSGWGVFTTPDGVRYAGEWRTDRYDGLGIVRYASGNRYEGEFLANKRHGRGLFLWKTTVRAQHHRLVWLGVCQSKNCACSQGEVYYGLWDNDLRMGQGCHMWPDGSKYEGEWAQGLQQGRGRYVWADGACSSKPAFRLSAMGTYLLECLSPRVLQLRGVVEAFNSLRPVALSCRRVQVANTRATSRKASAPVTALLQARTGASSKVASGRTGPW